MCGPMHDGFPDLLQPRAPALERCVRAKQVAESSTVFPSSSRWAPNTSESSHCAMPGSLGANCLRGEAQRSVLPDVAATQGTAFVKMGIGHDERMAVYLMAVAPLNLDS